MNPLNDVSTMNKTMEYMAFGLPVVAFDLRETRVSAGECRCLCRPTTTRVFRDGDRAGLLDDAGAARRPWASSAGPAIEDELAWAYQEAAYVGVYDRLVAVDRSRLIVLPDAAGAAGPPRPGA